MKNELTLQQKELVRTIEQHGITDVIKPLVKEIFLFDTFVAGTFYAPKELITSLKQGDKLILRREENNHFDDQAILILTEEMKKIGYIPEKDNAIFSRLMDAGKLLSAKVQKIDWKGDFSTVSIEIFLIDF